MVFSNAVAPLAMIAATVLAGAFVQGTTGVGFALVVAPVLGLLAPELLPATVLLLMVPLNVYVVWRERGSIDRLGAAWITGGRLVGTAGGFWVLVALSVGRLSLFVGLATALAVLATLAAPRFTPSRSAFVAAGVVTGITETATGIGGPPLALVYQHHPVATMRPTLALCFLLGQLMSLATLAIAGRIGSAQWLATAGLVPALALGAWLSHRVHRSVGGRFLRRFVLAFAFVSSLALIAKSL
ncbi:MAG TPA: sulfite exporter TauE/SafE family protein [Caldimonas sp.]|nr:sulfite exporter TauE/SafE family protein [Caldimonas sp.]